MSCGAPLVWTTLAFFAGGGAASSKPKQELFEWEKRVHFDPFCICQLYGAKKKSLNLCRSFRKEVHLQSSFRPHGQYCTGSQKVTDGKCQLRCQTRTLAASFQVRCQFTIVSICLLSMFQYYICFPMFPSFLVLLLSSLFSFLNFPHCQLSFEACPPALLCMALLVQHGMQRHRRRL